MSMLKSMCLCIVRIMLRKNKQEEDQNQCIDQDGKNNINLEQHGDLGKPDPEELDIPITELVRQFAKCNYMEYKENNN